MRQLLRIPNLAVLCFLGVPFLALGAALLAALGVPFRPGTGTRLAAMGALGLAACIPLAARLRVAPHAATVLGAALVWAGYHVGVPAPEGLDPALYDVIRRSVDGSMLPFVVLALLGAGLPWLTRELYRNDFDAWALPQHTMEGLSRLLRRDPGAGKRLLLGLGLLIAALALLFTHSMDYSANPGWDAYSHANVAVGLLLMSSLGLLASAFALREEELPPPPPDEEPEEEADDSWVAEVGMKRFLTDEDLEAPDGKG